MNKQSASCDIKTTSQVTSKDSHNKDKNNNKEGKRRRGDEKKVGQMQGSNLLYGSIHYTVFIGRCAKIRHGQSIS